MPDQVDRSPWDRLPGETSKAYLAFRQFRDAGPRRTHADATSTTRHMAKSWAHRHSWTARAVAWDDESHRREDLDRLDALRSMHGNHARAARALQAFALRALQALDADSLTASDVARLFELGAKLERLTLSQSVEELANSAGISSIYDPWAKIADELLAGPASSV